MSITCKSMKKASINAVGLHVTEMSLQTKGDLESHRDVHLMDTKCHFNISSYNMYNNRRYSHLGYIKNIYVHSYLDF